MDQNFRLLASGGSGDFVLKISNSDEDPGLIEAQVEALTLLQVEPGPLRTARVLPCRTGSMWTREGDHVVWLVSWLDGTVLADATDPPPELWRELGRGLGDLDRRLAAFDAPGARRAYEWDLRHAGEALRRNRSIEQAGRRRAVRGALERFRDRVVPLFPELPQQVIHNDANDYNLLVRGEGEGARVDALLDFGDLVRTARACEIAVAATYAMLGAPDPMATGSLVLAGYHEALGMERAEIRAVPHLIEARLCLSVTMSAYRRSLDPANAYLSVSEAAAWDLFERLSEIPVSRRIERFEDAGAGVRPIDGTATP